MLTTFFKNLVANAVFHADSVSIPGTYYIGLSSTEPNENGENVSEPIGSTGYSRVSLNNMFSPAIQGVIQNKAPVSFPTATASQGLISYYCIFDNSVGGNLCVYGALNESKNVGSQDTLSFPAGELEIQVIGQ